MPYELTFLGLVLSLIFIGIFGIYPGGIIVPGYLVLFMDQPLRLAATLAVALVTLGIYKLISRRLLLFGRRRFVFLLLLAGCLVLLSHWLLPRLAPVSPEYRVIGWIIPGLIANHLERQGVLLTLLALITVTVATYFLGFFWQALF